MSDILTRSIPHDHAPCPGCVELEELLKAEIIRLRVEVERLWKGAPDASPNPPPA